MASSGYRQIYKEIEISGKSLKVIVTKTSMLDDTKTAKTLKIIEIFKNPLRDLFLNDK